MLNRWYRWGHFQINHVFAALLFLQSCLRFNDSSTRQERKGLNNRAPIVKIPTKLEAFQVGVRFVSLFQLYIRNKPEKYGIKMNTLVTARNV